MNPAKGFDVADAFLRNITYIFLAAAPNPLAPAVEGAGFASLSSSKPPAASTAGATAPNKTEKCTWYFALVRHACSQRIASGIVFATLLTGCSQAPKEPTAKTEKTLVAAPVYFKVDAATSGAITGKISFTGKRPQPRKIDVSEDPQCARMHTAGLYDEGVVVNRNGTLANVFVYIKQGLEGKTFEPPATPVTIDQSGCWFKPRVIGIETGELLNVTNSDPVTHNIHPLAQVNRAWNQSQDPGAEPLKRRFKEREVMIRVKCNIHSWMRAWIGVVEHPYFAVTGADGSFEIKNVPPGDYTLEVWHEQYGTQERRVTVKPSGKEDLAFTFKGE